MADDAKKTSYTTWVLIIGAIVVALALAVLFYLLWKKLSAIDLRMSEKAKVIDDAKAEIVRLGTENKARDEKIQDLGTQMSALRETNAELRYKLKELKGKSPSQSIQIKGKSKQCNDESCSLDEPNH